MEVEKSHILTLNSQLQTDLLQTIENAKSEKNCLQAKFEETIQNLEKYSKTQNEVNKKKILLPQSKIKFLLTADRNL